MQSKQSMDLEQPDQEFFRQYLFTRYKLGISAKDVFEELEQVYPETSPSLRTVYRWMKEFSEGTKTSCTDLPRPGRPRTSHTAQSEEKLKAALEEDAFLSLRQLAAFVQLDKSTESRMMHEMGYRHITGLWIPHQLKQCHYDQRLACANSILEFLRSGQDVVYSYAVQDETWVYFDWHSQSSKKAWVAPDGDRPTMVKFTPMTPRKSLLSVVFSPCGRFHVETYRHGETMTSEKFITFLRRTAELWRKRRVNSIKLEDEDVVLQIDNAPPHTASATKQYLACCGVKTLKQAPYSPDLNLADRFLFRSMKHSFKPNPFNSHEDVRRSADEFMKNISESTFAKEMKKLEKHCILVIEKHGDYVDCESNNC